MVVPEVVGALESMMKKLDEQLEKATCWFEYGTPVEIDITRNSQGIVKGLEYWKNRTEKGSLSVVLTRFLGVVDLTVGTISTYSRNWKYGGNNWLES